MKFQFQLEWKNAVDEEALAELEGKTEFIKNIVDPINRLEGDYLPVSAFNGMEDGTFEAGTAAYRKKWCCY